MRNTLYLSIVLALSPCGIPAALAATAEGLEAGRVSIDANGFALSAYCASPTGKTHLPVVLVVQEIFGVHEYIADVCRRLARHGYMAIAPELYSRQGDASKYTDMARLMSELVSKVPDAQVMGDLDATVAWARAEGQDTARLGVTGFCWGGRITWLFAEHSAAVKAGVAWYGRLTGATNPLQPRHPLDLVAELKAPVLGLYGGQDTGIPLDTVRPEAIAQPQVWAGGGVQVQSLAAVAKLLQSLSQPFLNWAGKLWPLLTLLDEAPTRIARIFSADVASIYVLEGDGTTLVMRGKVEIEFFIFADKPALCRASLGINRNRKFQRGEIIREG